MPWTQKELGCEAEMKQARISAMEKPGEVAFTLETLIRLASAFRVGLKIEFVPFSEMVKWDDGYNQDAFSVTPIEKDEEFLNPSAPAPFTVTTSFYPFNPTPSGAWSTIAVNGIYMDVDGAGHSDFPLYTPFSTGIPVAFHSIAGNRDKELAA
jgi:transcriptional regulator with XRE-family HTH domain